MLAACNCAGGLGQPASPAQPDPELIVLCHTNRSEWAQTSNLCSKPEYVKWKKLPLLITSVQGELAPSVQQSVAVWNDWMDREVFRYEPFPQLADVIVVYEGDGGNTRAYASWGIFDEWLRGKIAVFDSAVGDAETMVHEMGHILGLTHDAKNPRSIMYPYTQPRYLPWLEPQDKRALDKLLPKPSSCPLRRGQ